MGSTKNTSITDRRLMLHTLAMSARDGKVYKRELNPLWIQRMIRLGYIRETGKRTGVYEVLRLEL